MTVTVEDHPFRRRQFFKILLRFADIRLGFFNFFFVFEQSFFILLLAAFVFAAGVLQCPLCGSDLFIDTADRLVGDIDLLL